MSGKQGERPDFQPDGGWFEAVADLVESIARALRSLGGVVDAFKRLDGGERSAAGRGLLGAVGLVGGAASAHFELIAAPFWAYALVVFVFQAPWIAGSLPAVGRDSRRRKAISGAKKQDEALQDYFKRTAELRHAWAASLVGPLSCPLEQCEPVGEAMEEAVQEIASGAGYSFALVLVARRNGHYEIVLTRGEVSDCLKTGTRWPHSEMNVYQYIDQRSLYPHHLIEREFLGGAEYFLVAASEIDVIGEVRKIVLDCYLDVVRHGIGRVVAHGDA